MDTGVCGVGLKENTWDVKIPPIDSTVSSSYKPIISPCTQLGTFTRCRRPSLPSLVALSRENLHICILFSLMILVIFFKCVLRACDASHCDDKDAV